MHSIHPRTMYIWQMVSSFILALVLCETAQATSWYMKPWKEVYRQIHPSTKPNWKSLSDAQEWARNEQALVEPVLLRILNSEYDDIPWTHGLPVAHEVPTGSVKDVLHARLQEMVNEVPDGCMTSSTTVSGAVTSIIVILGHSRDARVTPIALALASKDCQPALVVERCVEALRNVGDGETIAQLRRIPLRGRSEHIDRMAALTEKIIQARIEGKMFPPQTAPQELRAVTTGFLRALENRDFDRFQKSFPAQVREIIDERKMAEFLEQDPPLLPGIRAALDAETPFEIDRDKLQAKLICDDQYVVEFIYEIDGWKLMNVKLVRSGPRSDASRP